MSAETKCGICGEVVPSLEALSKHECKISLKEAYDRAFAGAPEAPLTATARADQFGACVFFNRGGSDFRSAMPDEETALLVAAAPDLLAAAKAAMAPYGHEAEIERRAHALLAAINKAKGRDGR